MDEKDKIDTESLRDLIQRIKDAKSVTDTEFDAFLPREISLHSGEHFTPIHIAKAAAQFLANYREIKLLDIGSGVGKFCIVAACTTKAQVVGIEQRSELHAIAHHLTLEAKLKNLEFLLGNIESLSFRNFDAFYLFNPFLEHLSAIEKLNNSVIFDKQLYKRYGQFVKAELDKLPIGTRLATYFGYLQEVPESYILCQAMYDNNLRLWEKQS